VELKDAIDKRRTIRDFRSDPVPLKIIRDAIEQGCKAPSYNHQREWDFIIVQHTETRLSLIEAENLEKEFLPDELQALFRNEDPLKREMYLDAIPKQKRMILTAPVVLVVVYKPKTAVDKARKVYDLNCLASVWHCIENILLSLAEQDVFGVTYIPQHTSGVKEKLGIPCELEVAAIIPIGYKAEQAKIPKQIMVKIDERIHFEAY
jgi:nitroreductase